MTDCISNRILALKNASCNLHKILDVLSLHISEISNDGEDGDQLIVAEGLVELAELRCQVVRDCVRELEGLCRQLPTTPTGDKKS
jgi:hypothetical protein